MDEVPKGFKEHMDAINELCRLAYNDGIDIVMIAREANPFNAGVKYALRRTCDMALAIGMLNLGLNFVQDELIDGDVHSE